jgi:hypothetical protein
MLEMPVKRLSTGGIYGISSNDGGNPTVLHPGFEPEVMSLRPARPPPYNQGFRKLSRDSYPFDTRSLFGNKKATHCLYDRVSYVLKRPKEKRLTPRRLCPL